MNETPQGTHHVEPAYAGLVESVGSEVHGVAFCMTFESAESLDRYLHKFTGRTSRNENLY